MARLTSTITPILIVQIWALSASAQGVKLCADVLLEGPWDPTAMQMNTDLLDSSLLPLAEPYTSLGYPAINGGGETVDSLQMHTAFWGGGGKAVDWVRVELRSAADATDVVAVNHALVREDGTIYNGTMQGLIPNCGNGTSVIIPADTNTSDPLVSPFTNQFLRARHQYLFQASELDLLQHAQVNPLATDGLCPSEPIYRIGFQVTGGVSRICFYSITIKHSSFSSLSGFDNAFDPLASCANNPAPVPMPNPSVGVVWFNLNTPFIWDGMRNVVIDFCYATAGIGVFDNAAVQATSGLAFNGSYSLYTNSVVGTCGAVGGCMGTTLGCGINLSCVGVNGGPSTTRPVVHWGGVVATSLVMEASRSPLTFNVPDGDYYVAVRHRNHLGCMTAAPLHLDSNLTCVDFTASYTNTFGSGARKPTVNSKRMLYAGNTFNNGELGYAGLGNDRDPILVRIGGSVPTNVVNGYFVEDVDLNGQVKYTGPGNDRDPILVNIGGSTPQWSARSNCPDQTIR